MLTPVRPPLEPGKRRHDPGYYLLLGFTLGLLFSAALFTLGGLGYTIAELIT